MEQVPAKTSGLNGGDEMNQLLREPVPSTRTEASKRGLTPPSTENSPGGCSTQAKKRLRNDECPSPPFGDSLDSADDANGFLADPDYVPEGDSFAESDDQNEWPVIKDKGGEWTTVHNRGKKPQLKAVERAQRTVERRNPGYKLGSVGFEVEFVAADGEERFQSKDLFKIFKDIQEVVAEAQPRLSKKGGIVVRVPAQSNVDKLKAMTAIAGRDVELVLPSQSSLWGRISGVHPMFPEEDLLDALKPQGVVEVTREKYSTCMSGARVQKPSNRVRLRFNSELRPDVTILRRLYRVTLCAASPLQCLSCCGFGHKVAVCPKKTSPRCRKCGAVGHQLWQCGARAKCVNCKGPHCSNSPRCPVYAVYAKAARDRQVGRVVAGLENTMIEESTRMLSGEAPPTAAGDTGHKPSFADVVRKPTMKALVQTTEDGNKVLCYLPLSPANGPKQKRQASLSTKPRRVALPSLSNDDLVATVKEQVLKEVRMEMTSMMRELFTSFKNEMSLMVTELVSTLKNATSGRSIPNQTRPNPKQAPEIRNMQTETVAGRSTPGRKHDGPPSEKRPTNTLTNDPPT